MLHHQNLHIFCGMCRPGPESTDVKTMNFSAVDSCDDLIVTGPLLRDEAMKYNVIDVQWPICYSLAT
jgi:hypothetical protein